MKKLVTLLLTAALATAAATTAFAADTTISAGTDGKPSPTAAPQMNVTYTVQPTYTVTIPAKVTLDSTTKKSEATVKAENVTVPHGQAVKVALTNANSFKVTSQEGAELTYKVTKNEQAVNVNDTVLSVASNAIDKKGETALVFEITDSVVYSGEYTGTVTFTVSVE